jgi:hypothetical protein
MKCKSNSNVIARLDRAIQYPWSVFTRAYPGVVESEGIPNG